MFCHLIRLVLPFITFCLQKLIVDIQYLLQKLPVQLCSVSGIARIPGTFLHYCFLLWRFCRCSANRHFENIGWDLEWIPLRQSRVQKSQEQWKGQNCWLPFLECTGKNRGRKLEPVAGFYKTKYYFYLVFHFRSWITSTSRMYTSSRRCQCIWKPPGVSWSSPTPLPLSDTWTNRASFARSLIGRVERSFATSSGTWPTVPRRCFQRS